jgi:hypothetical protein
MEPHFLKLSIQTGNAPPDLSAIRLQLSLSRSA